MLPDDAPASADFLPDWLAGGDAGPDSGAPLLRGLSLPDLALPDFALPDPAPAPEPRRVTDTPPPRRPATGDWDTAAETPEVVAGEAGGITLRLDVRNRSAEARECRAALPLPATVGVVRANRAPKRTRQGLIWKLGVLPPGTAVRLHVHVPAGAAARQFTAAPPTVTLVTRALPAPWLVATTDTPPTAVAGETVPVRVTVRNQGTGASGLYRLAAFRCDEPTAAVEACGVPLAPGHTHTTRLQLPPGEPGPCAWRVVVTAADSPPAHATFEVTTAGPDLALAVECADRIETDEETTCRVVVTNPGPVAAARVAVELSVPAELLFRGADARGALDESGERVAWHVPELPAGGRWEATARLAGFAPGRLTLTAAAEAPWSAPRMADAALVCEVRRTAGGASLAELLAGLAAWADDDLDAPTAPVADARERHLMFRAAGGRYAVPMAAVREVLRAVPVAAVPGTPEWVAGVANVRGDIVTVVNLASLLGQEAAAEARALVLLTDADDHALGLLAEDVVGIRPLPAAAAGATADHLARFLAGVAVDDAGVVHLLAPDRLVAAVEAEAAAV